MQTIRDLFPPSLGTTGRTEGTMLEPTRFPRVARYREELANLTFEPVSADMTSFYKVLIRDAMCAISELDRPDRNQMAEISSLTTLLIEACVPVEIFMDFLQRLHEELDEPIRPTEGDE
ncbi:hypothetical protein NBRC3222_2507 [Acetobacter pasteurianus NBRC 3222]|nr:hypothetical protein NBRC3222_2507 [Acetobacter pasteurianus NBRC 3222]